MSTGTFTGLRAPNKHITTQVAGQLAERGWVATTAEDLSALDTLVRNLVDANTHVTKPVTLDKMLEAFIASNPRAATVIMDDLAHRTPEIHTAMNVLLGKKNTSQA